MGPSSASAPVGSVESQIPAAPSPKVQIPCQFGRSNDKGSAKVDDGSTTAIKTSRCRLSSVEASCKARELAVQPPLLRSSKRALLFTSVPKPVANRSAIPGKSCPTLETPITASNGSEPAERTSLLRSPIESLTAAPNPTPWPFKY